MPPAGSAGTLRRRDIKELKERKLREKVLRVLFFREVDRTLELLSERRTDRAAFIREISE